MSIDHKAYLFDHAGFERELARILYDALASDNAEPVREFIRDHRHELTDAWTEETLTEDWEDNGEERDLQGVADLALSKYFDLTNGNRGLSYAFDALHAYLRSVPGISSEAELLISGHLFGPPGHWLDPGRMGTGILTTEQAARLHERLEGTRWPPVPGAGSETYSGCFYLPESADEVARSLSHLRKLYSDAAHEGKGILLMDFNDCGVSDQ